VKPYVVRQGDYLAKVAHQLGFDADVVWADEKNKELAGLRDPNLLLPGDILYVPEGEAKPELSVNEGDSHDFQAHVPEVIVKLVLHDDEGPMANEAYVINGLGDPVEGTTGDDGRLSFTTTVLVREAELVLPKRNIKYPIHIGDMDPLVETSGAKKRLTHLGYGDPDRDDVDDGNSEELSPAVIQAFQIAQGLPVTGAMDDATVARLKEMHGC
jgi:hypothetical protein